MRNIWFFGDSTTFGHGLRIRHEYYEQFPENRKKLWTEHVSDYFGGNEINFAYCGASNEDIKFRVSTNLYKIKTNDVVVIQYTHSGRINLFDKYNDYCPVHVSTTEKDIKLGNSNFDKEQLINFEGYVKSFIVDNLDKFEMRDIITLLSFKKELENRGIICILWSHHLISIPIRKHYNWDSIKTESKGVIDDDYHMGFDAQEKFSDFLINQFEGGNTFVNPNSNYSDDVENINFNNHQLEETLDNLFEDVRSYNFHKNYNESHIFF
jgi:hypothetical protein